MIKKILSLILSLMLIMCFAGCEEETKASYDTSSHINRIYSRTVSSNSDYKLIWDNENSCVILKSLKNGKTWSNIPYEYLLEGGSSASVSSTLNITVMNTVSMKQDELRGYTEVIENGRVASEIIENGIRVIYHFDNYSISIPVEYTLKNNSLSVTVKTKEIVEAGEYILISFDLAPFMCSAPNTDSDAYLVVPSGSGALMNVSENADTTRKYSGEVYGEDAARIQPEVLIDNEQIYMPVFASVLSDGNALMGIIESGAQTAKIEAEAGNSRTGWSNIYPKFYVRGYDSYPTTQFIWSYQDLSYFSKDITDMVVTVGYYPLYNAEANYVGVANKYREYLKKQGRLLKSDAEYSPYALSLIGGAQKTVATGGIPHKVTSVVTTFSEAQNIINDLVDSTGKKPIAQLIGYGDCGLDAGKIAGGYKFSSDFGGDKGHKTLEQYCKENKIDIFTDFELIRFSKSGNGFSYQFDVAKSASLNIAESYLINTPLRNYDESTAYRFLKKSQIFTAVDKLINMADENGMSGISLSSLSNVAYSDFSHSQFGVKGKTGELAFNSFVKIKDSNRKVSASAANDYAAGVADVLFCTPLDNGEYDVFSEWIPLYQMVFAGSRPMYSSYINLEANAEKAIMSAIASGTGLGFALTNSYDIDLAVSKTFSLYGTVYEDNKELILNSVKLYGEYYKAINGAQINNYILNENGVTVTEFSNGVKVYVNHTENTASTEIGEIAPLTAKWIGN